ncbi:MAG: hypothetical protein K1X63_05815 [Chitinophagales bacterium]|nr:hypothetical protein [Chitinophagales bacterium]
MNTPITLRNKLQLVLIITLCWMFFAAFSFINNYYFVKDLVALNKLSGNYPFWADFTGKLILGLFGGVIGGYILVFKMRHMYRQRSFAFGILNAGILFIVFYLSLAVAGLFFMGFFYFLSQDKVAHAATRSWQNVIVNLNAPSFFITLCSTALVVSFTQFMLQVNDKFGQGVLLKFITGKYYHPREEERIFMFLDLKSSTSIAEKIGSKNFFELLKETFNVITEPIVSNQGEIYQYVGDEVVVSWPIEKGLANNNCLMCFFHVEQLLKKRSDHFVKNFGVVPSFKAGLHVGEATVGEIGVIKKDIVFSGDVLNTTSRIQNECNNHNVNILLSAQLLDRLPADQQFVKHELGEILLKGKQEKIKLHSISLTD